VIETLWRLDINVTDGLARIGPRHDGWIAGDLSQLEAPDEASTSGLWQRTHPAR
jgi:hypothetical protein